jgi:hypothetical protein
VWYVNTFGGVPARLRRVPWDAIILHTILLCLRWSELFAWIRQELRWLGDLPCPKIALPQDEYDHSELLEEWLLELGVSDVFSVFEGPARTLLYPRLAGQATFHKCFTGYIDEATARALSSRLVPTLTRQFDIVYRATHLPYWFGSHGQLKHRIAPAVATRARDRGLRTDISTRVDDTILGDRWFDFLMSGRTVLGCESGSSVLDRRGEMQARIQALLGRQPQLSFEEVSHLMPRGWDGHSFFALSPRHFESVITKTCQVLVEGEYEGVFEADRHYISLKRDFSNMDEILDRIRDGRRVEQIAETAYEEIYRSGKYGYSALALDVEAAILRHGGADRRPTGVRLGVRVTSARMAVAQRDQAGRAAAALRRYPPLAWLHRHGVLARLRLASRAAKWLLTARVPWQVRGLRRVLVIWCLSRQARRTAGLSHLLADLAMLGVVRDVVDGRVRHDFTVEMRYDAELAELRFESRRQGHEDGSELPAVGQLGRVPLRSIVWDHGAMGRWVSTHPARPGVDTWLGPEGQYRFDALVCLAGTHGRLIWGALVPSHLRHGRASS